MSAFQSMFSSPPPFHKKIIYQLTRVFDLICVTSSTNRNLKSSISTRRSTLMAALNSAVLSSNNTALHVSGTSQTPTRINSTSAIPNANSQQQQQHPNHRYSQNMGNYTGLLSNQTPPNLGSVYQKTSASNLGESSANDHSVPSVRRSSRLVNGSTNQKRY